VLVLVAVLWSPPPKKKKDETNKSMKQCERSGSDGDAVRFNKSRLAI
jgi:hypothetical protein